MPGRIGLEKLLLEVRRADTAVTAPVNTEVESAPWLAECLDALGVATLVSRQVRRYAVLGTGLAMVADPVRGIAS